METGEGEVRAEAPGRWNGITSNSRESASPPPFLSRSRACIAGDPRIRLQPDPRRIFPVSPSVYNRRLITCCRARSRVAPARANMLRRSLTSLAGVATRAQAARAVCVPTLSASSFATASAGSDREAPVTDRVSHAGLAVAAAFRGASSRLGVGRVVARAADRARRSRRGPPRANGDAYARRDGSRAPRRRVFRAT